MIRGDNHSVEDYIKERFNSRRTYPSLYEKTKKNRKIILIVNGILLLIMIYIFKSKGLEPQYYTKTIQDNNITYRLSIGSAKNRDRYFAVISIKRDRKVTTDAVFLNPIATMIITHNKSRIIETSINSPKTPLSIAPGEVKSIAYEINDFLINEYIENHREELSSTNKLPLLGTNTKYIPLTAEVIIGTKKTPSFSLDFKYEVHK